MDQPGKDQFHAARADDSRNTPLQGRADLWPQPERAGLSPLPYRHPPHNNTRSLASNSFGLERRLPRRAETMWEQLATHDTPPPESAAAQFLRGDYGANALRLCATGNGDYLLDFIGEGLQSITQLHCGRYLDGCHGADQLATQIGEELIGLAQAAIRQTTPVRLETERIANRIHPGHPHLLLRAVALPFSASGAAGPLAVVVASWRKLLSLEETAALHRELTAAMDWIRRQRA